MKKTLLLITLFWTVVTFLQTNPGLAADKCQDHVRYLLDTWDISSKPITKGANIRVYGNHENKRLQESANTGRPHSSGDIRKHPSKLGYMISATELNELAKKDKNFNKKLRDERGNFSNVSSRALWDENVKVSMKKGGGILMSRGGFEQSHKRTATGVIEGKNENYYSFEKSYNTQIAFDQNCEFEFFNLNVGKRTFAHITPEICAKILNYKITNLEHNLGEVRQYTDKLLAPRFRGACGDTVNGPFAHFLIQAGKASVESNKPKPTPAPITDEPEARSLKIEAAHGP